MDVTFLIGNGFDFGIGLKTGYKDFYDVYCQSKSSDSEMLQHFKSDILKEPETWADFESAFGEYASRCKNAEDYMQLFEDFIRQFSIYLENEESAFDESKTEEMLRGMKKALSSYYDIRPADKDTVVSLIESYRKTFNFISFNYTCCLDKCIDAVKSTPNSLASISGEIGELVHVHGYTDKDLIMGVNDASQIENETFSQDETVLNELVKPRQNEIIKMNYDYRATQIINRSRIICVYGMSIGETDQKWWKLIMQWLQRDINNHLIVLRHRAPIRMVPVWRRFVESTRNLLYMHGEVSAENQRVIANQIHIDVDHNIFAMDLTKSTRPLVCKSLL